jgi:superfamily I DNA/RNA helicase
LLHPLKGRSSHQTRGASLPDDSTLAEVLEFVRAQTPDEMDAVRVAIIERLQLPPLDDLAEEGVSVKTMHGAKGLAAKIVFIPGLEEEILPGPRRAGNQGLVLEGARLLYVSLTRARAAVVCSFASGRFQNGVYQHHHPSRYLGSLGVPAVGRSSGFTAAEAASVATASRAVD